MAMTQEELLKLKQQMLPQQTAGGVQPPQTSVNNPTIPPPMPAPVAPPAQPGAAAPAPATGPATFAAPTGPVNYHNMVADQFGKPGDPVTPGAPANPFSAPSPMSYLPQGSAITTAAPLAAVAQKQQVAADVTNSPKAEYDAAKAASTARRAGTLDSDSWRAFMGGVKAGDPSAKSYTGRTAAGVVQGAQDEEQELMRNRQIAEQMGANRDVGMAKAEADKEKAKAPIAAAQERGKAARDIAESAAKGREAAAKASGDARVESAGIAAEGRATVASILADARKADLEFKEKQASGKGTQEDKKLHASILMKRYSDISKMILMDSGEQKAAMKEIEDQLGNLMQPQGAAAPSASPKNINDKGWKLHVDSKGNKAYVGPKGEIEPA